MGFRLAGGLFSVALSLGSPPPAVNRHRIPVEPGLSSIISRQQRSSGRLARGTWDAEGAGVKEGGCRWFQRFSHLWRGRGAERLRGQGPVSRTNVWIYEDKILIISLALTAVNWHPLQQPK